MTSLEEAARRVIALNRHDIVAGELGEHLAALHAAIKILEAALNNSSGCSTISVVPSPEMRKAMEGKS